MNMTRSSVLRQSVLVAVMALTVWSGSAYAEPRVVVFPRWHVIKMEDGTNLGAPWGDYASTVYDRLISSPGNNAIWSRDRVFYTFNSRYESWFDVAGGEKTWQIYIDNPTDVDYTNSGTDRRIKLYVYNYAGNKLTEQSRWKLKPSGEGGLLICQDTGMGNILWDSGLDCFMVSVPAYSTIVVSSCYAPSAWNRLFNDPVDNEYESGSIRLEKPDGALFYATMRGQASTDWRECMGDDPEDFSTPRYMEAFGYDGIDLDFYGTGDDTIELPYFRETYSLAAIEWSTMVFVVNADASEDTIHIEVLNSDGTLLNSYDKILPANQKFHFMPSQFIVSATPVNFMQGKIRITGAAPVAVAWNMRFPKTPSTIWSNVPNPGEWRNTRMHSTAVLDFVINP